MRCWRAIAKGLKWGLILTVILGAVFTGVQALEYSEAGFFFGGENATMYGATFFMATGLHGLHVLIGTVFLLVCLIRALRGDFTPSRHLGFEFAAWYWHFVDVVWLFLFASIYVWFGARLESTRRALISELTCYKGAALKGPPFLLGAVPGRCAARSGALLSRGACFGAPGWVPVSDDSVMMAVGGKPLGPWRLTP